MPGIEPRSHRTGMCPCGGVHSEVDLLRAALKRILAIGGEPRDSMTYNRREAERRGQAMMDVANAALRPISGVTETP